MNVTALSWLCFMGFALIALAWIAALKARLKQARGDLARARNEAMLLRKELEALRDAGRRIRDAERKKGPERKKAPAPGDSDARLARLNRLPEHGGKRQRLPGDPG